MDDGAFTRRVQAKIERLTDRSIELQIDHEDANQLQVEMERGKSWPGFRPPE